MADTNTTLIKQVSTDMATAMKAQEKERLAALRFLKSSLLENSTSKKPLPELDVIISHTKKLESSLTSYPDGHGMQAKIREEIAFLAPYLPKAISEKEVQSLIENIIKNGANNMGLVMKELSPNIKGKFDGKRAQELVTKALQG